MLIIEDGTMPEGANSYVSLKDVDDYLVLRGLWDATPEAEGESWAGGKSCPFWVLHAIQRPKRPKLRRWGVLT